MISPSIAARVTFKPVAGPPIPGFLSLCMSHTETFYTADEFIKWLADADEAVTTNPEFKYGIRVEVETPTMPVRKFTINPILYCDHHTEVYTGGSTF